MRVTFWGVRGTFPAVGAEYARYGGDTMCVEVECGETRLILDAGTGLRALGAALNKNSSPIVSHIVLSHLHLDHVMGLPHFAPLWRRDARVHIHVAAECLEEDADALETVLRPPLFPLDVGALPAAVGIEEFRLDEEFMPAPDVTVQTVALSHQGPCAAIIVLWRGRKLCYVTDHEHGDAHIDDRLARAIEGADLLIYDATFADSEMSGRRGWGHSSWEEGVRLKGRAQVDLLALAHHDPDRTDAAIDALAEAACARESNVFFAKQGLCLGL
jgi:phosphoribosyl 1,2-cyclic phosphodiesterase